MKSRFLSFLQLKGIFHTFWYYRFIYIYWVVCGSVSILKLDGHVCYLMRFLRFFTLSMYKNWVFLIFLYLLNGIWEMIYCFSFCTLPLYLLRTFVHLFRDRTRWKVQRHRKFAQDNIWNAG